MTKGEIKRAFKLSRSDADLSEHDISVFDGCALPDFKYPIHTTIEAVAKLFRYQALMFNGEWDLKELSECAWIARKKFIAIN